ncbi:hypothetical protein GCM10009760_04070 [Kitasatospora kazusensis]|uniref:Integral membrane protein n=1 Tax=Kitasatospora kazusensis TaxID=407974 RepID=A0ABN2YQP7_9ACTN
MDTRQDEVKRDLDAAVQTRKELGKEYEAEIVDSFLARLDSRLDARVEQRVAERLAGDSPRKPGKDGTSQQFKLQVVSLAMGIPLSGIAGGLGGLTGLVVCWAGIVGVNVAGALSDRRTSRERARGEWS